MVVERNYLEEIFDNNDYESAEEKAMHSIVGIPDTDNNFDQEIPSRRKTIRYEEI